MSAKLAGEPATNWLCSGVLTGLVKSTASFTRGELSVGLLLSTVCRLVVNRCALVLVFTVNKSVYKWHSIFVDLICQLNCMPVFCQNFLLSRHPNEILYIYIYIYTYKVLKLAKLR